MFLTYKYRLLPTKNQHKFLTETCETQRILYNAALEERIGAYRTEKKSISYQGQCKSLTECRRDIPEMNDQPANLQRWTIRRLDDAFKAFFKRVKKNDGKAGFPRFRGKGWWHSFGFAEFSGIRFDGKRIKFKGLPGSLNVHMHRQLPENAEIKSCVFSKDLKGWSVGFQSEIPTQEKREISSEVGIDMGINVLAFMSDGSTIPNPRAARNAEKAMRVQQRAFSRCKKGSKNRQKVRKKLAKLHEKISNTRKTALNQASALLVKKYDFIAIEKLNVKGLAMGMLAKSVHDASWSILTHMIRYKAERAGSYLVEVDPKYTSQDCSGCGTRVKKTLSQRVHTCNKCGLVLDRDHNSAKVILAKADRAVVRPVMHNVTECGERASGNILTNG